MQGLAVMFLAAFSQLPNRITNWEDNENDLNAIEQWRESVKSGPHFDNDIWYINYVAHPTVGSWYYSLARINGMSPSASFAYAVFLSTMWEYTTEATKERPSIQDLIITPVIGSLLGEVSYRLIKKIENNNNRVWGSKLIGKTIKTLLNPTIPATRFVKKTLGKFVKVGDVKLQVFYRVITESSTFNFKKKSNNSPALGVRMTVDFNL